MPIPLKIADAGGRGSGIVKLKNKLKPTLMDFLNDDARNKIETEGYQNKSKSFIESYVKGYLEGIRQKNNGKIPYDKDNLKKAIIRDFKKDNGVNNQIVYSRHLARTVSSTVNEASIMELTPERLNRHIKTSIDIVNPAPMIKSIGLSAGKIGQKVSNVVARKMRLKKLLLDQKAFEAGKKRSISSINQARIRREAQREVSRGVKLGGDDLNF